MLKIILKSIMGGICISIGGIVYLMSPNAIVGAFLFSIGLLTIIANSFMLYTGQVGYLGTKKDRNLGYLFLTIVTWAGNFIGCFTVAKIISFTRIYPMIYDKVNSIVEIKMNDAPISIFILSIFCGILMYVAVDGNRECIKKGMYVTAVTLIILPVVVFILSGFEHVVANMFYFSLANALSFDVFKLIMIMSAGNAIGAMLFPLVKEIK